MSLIDARLNADGVALEYRWFGEADEAGPVIVLLHEGLGSVSLWRDLPEHLARRTGLRVFAWSRRGYGHSDPLTGPRTPDYLRHEAEAVLPAVLAAAGISRPILFGHSDEATIALIFASAFPGAARALVLEAPHVFVEDITIAGIEAFAATFETAGIAGRLARHHRDPQAVFRAWRDIWLDPAFRDWTIEDRLGAVICPLLIIQGEDDQYGTARQCRAIVEGAGHGEVMLLPRCGHSPHRDQRDAVLAATARFVAAVAGRADG